MNILALINILSRPKTETVSTPMASRRITKTPDLLDKAGASASFLCALHCALLPIVVTTLPLVGLSFLATEPVEWTLMGVSALLGCSSLCLGYREHRSRRALLVLSVGLALLVLGRVSEERGWEPYGMPLMVCGGLIIAISHLINRKLCHLCRACQHHGGGHE